MRTPLFGFMAWLPCDLIPWSGLWFRMFGYGLHVSTKPRSAAAFSERYGYRKAVYVFGLRVEVLTP